MCRRRQQSIEMNGLRELSEQGKTAPNIYATIKLPCAYGPMNLDISSIINPRLILAFIKVTVPPKLMEQSQKSILNYINIALLTS